MSKNTDQELLFRRFLDGELSDTEMRDVFIMLGEDADLRDFFRFELNLLHAFRMDESAESFNVPNSFTSSVMDRIEGKSDANQLKLVKKSGFISPWQVTINPLMAIAASLLITLLLVFAFISRPVEHETAFADQSDVTGQLVSQSDSDIYIRFVFFDDDAESVEIAGDFSDWNPVPLSRDYMGDKVVWTGLVLVNRGENRYMFVRNGDEWITDPLATVQRDDGFGNKNAVLYL
jgi:hypothetical protein